MPVAIVDAFEMVQVQNAHQQAVFFFVPAGHLPFKALAPGGTIGQSGKRVDQGLLTLFLQVSPETQGLLLHARDAGRQTLQARGHFALAGIALELVVIHGAEQGLKPIVEHPLEAGQIGGVLNTALQAAHLFAQLFVQVARGGLVLGVIFTGGLQVALKRFEPFIELLEVSAELLLAAVVDRQHQHCQIVEDRQQFVPVKPMFQA